MRTLTLSPKEFDLIREALACYSQELRTAVNMAYAHLSIKQVNTLDNIRVAATDLRNKIAA